MVSIDTQYKPSAGTQAKAEKLKLGPSRAAAKNRLRVFRA